MVTGGSGCGLVSQRRRVGHAFANARPGSGVWAKNPKPSDRGSVSGLPGKTAVWGGGGGGGDPQPHDLDRSGGE